MKRVKKKATQGTLTGGKNRGEFDRLFLLELEISKRYQHKATLKRINGECVILLANP